MNDNNDNIYTYIGDCYLKLCEYDLAIEYY